MEFLRKHRALGVAGLSLSIICVDVCMASAEWQGDLSDYELATFNNPDQEDLPRAQTLNHFTLSDHGDVYVGAVNWLYRLNSRLEQIQNASTCDDSMPYNGMPCRQTNNYNKILVVDSTRLNSLITCGGVFDGRCQLRQLLDINNILSESVPDVAGFEDATTVSLIAPRSEGEKLYVGVTYTGENVDNRGSFSAITRRNLKSSPILAIRDDYDTIFFTVSAKSQRFTIKYVSVFEYSGFTYFIATQREDLNSAYHVSKINRVCQTGSNLDAYTEITIQCSGSDGSVYSLVQAAHFGPAGPDLAASLGLHADEQVLYAVFAKNQGAPGTSDVPTDHSALCVYRLADILAGFRKAVRGCIQDGNAYRVQYLSDRVGSFCNMYGGVQPDRFLCQPADGATVLYRYAKGIAPVSSTALLEVSGTLMSSIITSTEFIHTVAFIGTSKGDLLKGHIENNTTARLYERVPLDSCPVLTDIKINDTTREMHVLTEQKLIKMRVENCGQYTTCEACIGTDAGNDGDPYCGWCTLERKCSRYLECPAPDVSTRWLAYNAAQCIKITNVAPFDSLPISLTDQQMTLTIQQLPDLVIGQNYECYFGSYQSLATVTSDLLICTSPPSDRIPAIQREDDAVRVDLGVYSAETMVHFIDTSFHFYNCSVHSSCISCVGSRWACDWCVFDNRCTHNSSTCTKDNEIIITGKNNPVSTLPKGPGSCPQLQAQSGEVLLPNGIQRSITIRTENLPNTAQISSFECSLDIEEVPQTVDAQPNGDEITCRQKAYTYFSDNEPELEVRLTVTWTDTNGVAHILNDMYGFNVTLYKCEVQKPDCSRCVTARPELGCVWCATMPTVSGVCKLNETCSDNSENPYNGFNCPNPVLLEVFPLTGPIEGNTILAVIGTDIGQTFADVVAVLVGNQPCDLDGLSSHYMTGKSVSCRTRPESKGSKLVSLTIMGVDDKQQNSSGNVTFSYTDPRITVFEPRFGPDAGGTALSVSGEALDTGRHIEGLIGDHSCFVLPDRTGTALVCTTSEGQAGVANNLRLVFDGANRTSAQMYSYTESPTITRVHPLESIYSGGRMLNVVGQFLSTCQYRQIYVNADILTYKEECTGDTATQMLCKSPNITSIRIGGKHSLTFGFIMDGVSELLTWSEDNEIELEYFEDPAYVPFENGVMEEDAGSTLTILGERLDSAITASEIQVLIGMDLCIVNLVSDTALKCTLPENDPAPGDFKGGDTQEGLPVVWVIHSNLEFRIGYIRYRSPNRAPIAVASVSGAILACILFVAFCFVAKVYGAKREARLILQDMRALEKDLADEVRQAFAELQSDVTDLTRDLSVSGMPFVSHREYATNMLFIGQEIIPDTEDAEHPNEQVERAMCKFSQLLSNKNFLLLLIQTLDEESNSKLSIREKQLIASLLTVTMITENKLVYLTDIMITLMTLLIENAADSNRTRQLFCRTESILDKLLSNWVAFCLYDHLKNHTAYPLFVLYRAIKCRSESGPIDVITGRSRFSLNYEKLLQEDVEFNSLTVVVLVNEEGEVTKDVKVLDVDTISQVKEKIIDSLYVNQPYSLRPSASQVSLEWRQGRSGKLVLTDTDVRPLTDNWRRINTLKDFCVGDNALMTLVEKQDEPNATLSRPLLKMQGSASYENAFFNDEKIRGRMGTKRRYSLAEVETREGVRDWHLTQEEEEAWPTDKEGSRQRNLRRYISLDAFSSRKKVTRRKIREISFPRLLSTKGIVQEYVDNMFQAILSVRSAPNAIKYLFDFFDNQAFRHDLSEKDPDLVRIWKSNILPLRFWANAIKHPDYIFDIRPSRSVEASLDVIAQLFHDAHDAKMHKLGRDTSVTKLLYGRERTKYHDDIVSFYEEVQQLPPVPTQELNKELYKACEDFTGLFSKLSTLHQLWKLVQRFRQKVLDEIRENERCSEENLDVLLEEIENILSEEPDIGEAAV